MRSSWSVLVLRALRPLILLALLAVAVDAGWAFIEHNQRSFPTKTSAGYGWIAVLALAAAGWLASVLLKEHRGG